MKLQQIIIECSALYVEATSSQSQVVQGGSLNINFNLIKREDVNASLKNISVENFDSSFSATLPINQNININKTLAVADDKKISQPYWLVYPLQGGTFDVRDQTLIGKAWNDPSFEATFTVNIDGEDFVIKRPVQYRYIDPVKGDTYQPIPVLPKIELNYTQDNFISMNEAPAKATMHLKSNTNENKEYKIVQEYSKNWTNDNPSFTYNSKDAEIYKTGTFTSKSSETNTTEQIGLKTADGKYHGYTKIIAYNHIPTITYFPNATANLVKA